MDLLRNTKFMGLDRMLLRVLRVLANVHCKSAFSLNICGDQQWASMTGETCCSCLQEGQEGCFEELQAGQLYFDP